MSKRVLIVGIILLGVVVGGVFMLRATGESFIREVTQDVVIAPVRPETIKGIGIPAPAGELADFDGARIEIADLFDAPLIVVFWTTWNPHAADTLGVFDEYAGRAAELSVSILAVNSQEEGRAVRAFLDRGGYKTRVLLDESGAVGQSYDIQTLPVVYFIGASGIVRGIKTGVPDRAVLESGIEEMIKASGEVKN
ncbi:MAG: TlpA disulfide reductase family protein [Patescibacteria group bacterium]